MDIVNTNRLRFSVGNDRRAWSTPWLMFGHYRSNDHGKQRPEHNFYAGLFGRVVSLKWRPDGKR